MGSSADRCHKCEECLPLCTQHMNIPEDLEKVREYFGTEFNHF